MRKEFNTLVELMKHYDLYQKDDEVGVALHDLSNKIVEVEKRLTCAKNTNKDIRSIKTIYEDVISFDNLEILERSVNDIDIALDLNDTEPIENDWYGLFAEPHGRAKDYLKPKILIPKGSIVEWKETIKNYNAKGGAKARVINDWTTDDESDDNTIDVEFIDELSNGQNIGGYFMNMFKEEFELPSVPTFLCHSDDNHNIVKDVISKLKDIGVDVETMQHILKEVGIEEQMLKQLVLTNPEIVTEDLLEKRRILSDFEFNETRRPRLELFESLKCLK